MILLYRQAENFKTFGFQQFANSARQLVRKFIIRARMHNQTAQIIAYGHQ